MLPSFPKNMQQIILGLGCFWGAERLFWRLAGVHVTAVGYAGGQTPHPTYEEVCSGQTGHTEAVLVVFDPKKQTLENLLQVFWQTHDPTQGYRQGNDQGTQYRSVIYATDQNQLSFVKNSAETYQTALTFSGFDKRDVQSEKNTTGLETTEAHFSNTSAALVRSTIQPVNNNIHFIEGCFPQTWSAAMDQMTFALVHLDADLYAPTKAGLEQFYPRLNAGGLVVIHDYNAWFGARTAVDEYCQENSLVPIPMPDKSGSCIILKPS